MNKKWVNLIKVNTLGRGREQGRQGRQGRFYFHAQCPMPNFHSSNNSHTTCI
ncbi:MAG: hypothetical protein ACRAVC_09040 [Trichormus sp.]